MTHSYKKAENYYYAALQKNPNEMNLRADLANLYFKLSNYKAANKIIE